MAQARSVRRRCRDRASPGIRGRGLRRRAYSRAQGAEGARACPDGRAAIAGLRRPKGRTRPVDFAAAASTSKWRAVERTRNVRRPALHRFSIEKHLEDVMQCGTETAVANKKLRAARILCALAVLVLISSSAGQCM